MPDQRDVAPAWWPLKEFKGKVIWPPEAMATDRLKRMMNMAAKVGDAEMMERCASILETRACGERAKIKARALGPDMLRLLSGIKGLCETNELLVNVLQEAGLLEGIKAAVDECQQPYYAKRGTAKKGRAVAKADAERAAIDATRPKGLANAGKDGG